MQIFQFSAIIDVCVANPRHGKCWKGEEMKRAYNFKSTYRHLPKCCPSSWFLSPKQFLDEARKHTKSPFLNLKNGKIFEQKRLELLATVHTLPEKSISSLPSRLEFCIKNIRHFWLIHIIPIPCILKYPFIDDCHVPRVEKEGLNWDASKVEIKCGWQSFELIFIESKRPNNMTSKIHNTKTKEWKQVKHRNIHNLHNHNEMTWLT